MHNHTLTNGAAHIACHCLQKGLHSIASIYAGGGLLIKLRAAKLHPAPIKDEIMGDFEKRLGIWFDAPFGDVDMTEGERDALKEAMKNLAEKKELPSNEYVSELIGTLGLHE